MSYYNVITIYNDLVIDFILDPGDVDSMSPWQLHLIEGHTFPHHILRTWYRHFDVSMDTTSVEDMYKTLCLLHAGRQAQVEQAQVGGREKDLDIGATNVAQMFQLPVYKIVFHMHKPCDYLQGQGHILRSK